MVSVGSVQPTSDGRLRIQLWTDVIQRWHLMTLLMMSHHPPYPTQARVDVHVKVYETDAGRPLKDRSNKAVVWFL